MITIHNWMATIPPEEACIAYVGEDEAVWREFLLTGERWERYMAWAFYLDMAFDPSGMPAPVEGEESVEAMPATDIAALEKSATPEGIALRWTVRRQQTRIPGRLRANLRALGPAGQVKKSATMLFEVQPSVSATPAAEVPVSAFEEMEQRMGVLADEARQAADEAAEARSEAASVARSAQTSAADADKSAVTAVNAAVSAADNAKVASQANTAAGNSASRANAAAIAAEAARVEAQAAADEAQDHAKNAANAALEALADAKENGDFGGTPGKSAYEYAQDGGYTGTEEKFAKKLAEVPLIGSTAEIMPVNVSALIGEGKPFAITHTDNTYGLMLFNSFVVSQAVGGVVSSTVFELGGVKFCAQLLGNITNNTWKFTAFSLAGADDIPTIPTALPNPQKLIINGTPYDGSKSINYTSVINAMIDAKIAEIPNASGVSF